MHVSRIAAEKGGRTIERVMREAEGNKSKAAALLGISRTQLYGRLSKYGIDLL